MTSRRYPVSAVVFDFGGVLFSNPHTGKTTPESRRIVTNTIQKIAHEHRYAINRGIFTSAQFRREFSRLASSLAPQRKKIVLRSVITINEAVLNLIQRLHGTHKIYGLVNAPYGWTEIRRSVHGLDAYFSRIVVSHEIDVRKPHPKIFRHFLKVTKLHAANCLFIDDQPENIRAAKQLGFQVHRYRNAKQLRQRLHRLV